MSYQEYLTGREYYQELTAARFSTAAVVKLFGDQPLDAFTDVKQHLVLQLLAGIFSPEQRTMCLAVMCGGRIAAPVLIQSSMSANSARCAVVRCPERHHNADGYCHNHRDVAASVLANTAVQGGVGRRVSVFWEGEQAWFGGVVSELLEDGDGIEIAYDDGDVAEAYFDEDQIKFEVLANTTVQGGDTMKIKEKLGRAEMAALAPYLRDNTRLRTLMLSGTELGKDKDGVKVLVELLARCVRVVLGFFPSYCLCLFHPRFKHHICHYIGTIDNALITNPTETPMASHSRQHPRHHLFGNTSDNHSGITPRQYQR
jgi:hypothetical protein